MKRLLIALVAMALASSANADGYGAWKFGMSRAEVAQQAAYGPYYTFSNGDLGSQSGPYEGHDVPISFYFTGEHLARVMLITYMGADTGAARDAWKGAFEHIRKVCGAVELPSNGSGAATLEAALEVFDASVSSLQPGSRIHIGAFPMPANRRVWASVTRLANGQLMVAVNYREA